MQTRLEGYFSRTTKNENGCLVYKAKNRPYANYRGKHMPLARIVYHLHTGTNIPDGYFVCHTCDNCHCINPDHLFLSTPLGNMRDAVRKGRHARGSKSGSAKLTEAKVLAMRLLARRAGSIRAVADAYSLSYGLAHSVVTGRSWKHVAGVLNG